MSNTCTPLPDDVWPRVFQCLDYQSILRCSEVCCHFLHHVIPKVKELVIERPGDMHVITARKLVGVESIELLCLMDRPYTLCEETSDRLVSFMGCFPAVKDVYINRFNYFSHRNIKKRHEIMRRLILSLCAAYRTGAVPPNAKVHGLFGCILRNLQEHIHKDVQLLIGEGSLTSLGCSFCTSICRSIPVDQACRINCAPPIGRESFGEETHDDFSLCLTAEEKLSILFSRNGGREAYRERFNGLYSNENIVLDSIWGRMGFQCDSSGTPCHHGSHQADAFTVQQDAVAELQILIDRFGFAPPLHSESHVIECLFKELCQEEQMTKDKDKCFITKSSFETLRKLGFPLSQRFFVLVDEELDTHNRHGRLEAYHEYAQEFTEEDLLKLRLKFRS